MPRYPEEFKRSIVKKILSNSNSSLRQASKENSLPISTVHGWLKRYGDNQDNTKDLTKKYPNDWTLEERFNILVETAGLSAEECGIYCRQKGIYQYQLTEWHEIFMKTAIDSKNKEELAELKTLRAENKALKKELRRKDSALAETSALLILKKKADYLWGEIEED